MPLFKIVNDKAEKLNATGFAKEKEVQTLFESNMREMLGLSFVASEYSTNEGGRLDSFALDDFGNPVIIEYKLNKGESVLSQGLYYMDWVMTHQGDIEVLVQKYLGIDRKVVWNNPRLIIIAGEYNKFDINAVNAIARDISLYKYAVYNDSLIYFDKVNVKGNLIKSNSNQVIAKTNKIESEKSIDLLSAVSSSKIKELFEILKTKIFELDENIEERVTGVYVGYSATRNFVEVWFKANSLQCQILSPFDNPYKIGKTLPDSYRWTLNFRVDIKSEDDIDKVMDLIKQSYNQTT